jgi:hypothetical protein
MIKFLPVVFTLGLSVSIQPSFSQTIDALTKQLTDSSRRVWKLAGQGKHEFLGDTCTEGLQYSFTLKNKIVTKSECVDHFWKKQTSEWVIAARGADYWITIGSAEYQLQFVRKDGAILLRLRQFDKSAINVTTDLYFEPLQNKTL